MKDVHTGCGGLFQEEWMTPAAHFQLVALPFSLMKNQLKFVGLIVAESTLRPGDFGSGHVAERSSGALLKSTWTGAQAITTVRKRFPFSLTPFLHAERGKKRYPLLSQRSRSSCYPTNSFHGIAIKFPLLSEKKG